MLSDAALNDPETEASLRVFLHSSGSRALLYQVNSWLALVLHTSADAI